VIHLINSLITFADYTILAVLAIALSLVAPREYLGSAALWGFFIASCGINHLCEGLLGPDHFISMGTCTFMSVASTVTMIDSARRFLPAREAIIGIEGSLREGRWMRAVWEKSFDGLVLFREVPEKQDLRVELINPSAKAMSGALEEGALLCESLPNHRNHVDDVGGPLIDYYLDTLRSGGASTKEFYYKGEEDEATGWWLNTSTSIDRMLLLMVFRDITHEREREQELQQLAFYDQLTGLANRSLFKSVLRGHLDRLESESKGVENPRNCVVAFLDVDDFKGINDTYGHAAGDAVLKAVADRIRCSIRTGSSDREGDIACRWSGDEMVVLFTNTMDAAIVLAVDRMCKRVSRPVKLGAKEVTPTISAGIAFSYPGITPDVLIGNADSAMYLSKSSKETRTQPWSFYSAKAHEASQEYAKLRQEVLEGLQNDEFIFYYQPIINLEDGSLAAFEALVRWNNPRRGLMAPGRFLPIVESAGLISQLSEVLLLQAIAQIEIWQETCSSIKIAFNTSPLDPHLEKLVMLLLAAGQERNIYFEIVEERDSGDLGEFIEIASKKGIKLAIDDWGTGFSGPARLVEHRRALHFIKLDRSAALDPEWARLLVSMARVPGITLPIIAEGIETREQMLLFKQLGVDFAQGYFFSRPVPAEVATDYVINKTSFSELMLD